MHNLDNKIVVQQQKWPNHIGVRAKVNLNYPPTILFHDFTPFSYISILIQFVDRCPSTGQQRQEMAHDGPPNRWRKKLSFHCVKNDTFSDTPLNPSENGLPEVGSKITRLMTISSGLLGSLNAQVSLSIISYHHIISIISFYRGYATQTTGVWA